MADSVTLEYHLADLPTAQHKAGLAGMLLLIEDLRDRGQAVMPELEINPYSASVSLTQSHLQSLMDDWYDAKWVETQSSKKRSDKPPKREEFVPGKKDGKQEKRYVYDDFQPKGKSFGRLFPGGSSSPWLKLWRDMLWGVMRAQPKTREEFKDRANGKSSKCAEQLWEKLLKQDKTRAKGGEIVGSIAGSIFIGAQNKNAERVNFQGSVDQNLLLHFWTLCCPIFIPEILDIKQRCKLPHGFLLVIPEVRDLQRFRPAMLDYWRRLDNAVAGYRPRASLIDLPEEGGLEFLYHLARKEFDRNAELLHSVSAVELYHLEKSGKNIRMLTATHVLPNRKILDRYAQLRKLVAHPVFKAMQISNLIKDLPWHARAAYWLEAYPAEFFLYSASTSAVDSFGYDVRRLFKQRIEFLDKLEKSDMSADEDDLIARRVYRMVGEYVRQRTDDRVGRGSSKREAREKVALDAFLAMRGRSNEEFTTYFTGTICSVPQYMGKEDEYLRVSRALVDGPERIRNLSMLALSAHAWTRKPKSQEPQTDEGE